MVDATGDGRGALVQSRLSIRSLNGDIQVETELKEEKKSKYGEEREKQGRRERDKGEERETWEKRERRKLTYL